MSSGGHESGQGVLCGPFLVHPCKSSFCTFQFVFSCLIMAHLLIGMPGEKKVPPNDRI